MFQLTTLIVSDMIDPGSLAHLSGWLAGWHPVNRKPADTSVPFMLSPKGKDKPCSA